METALYFYNQLKAFSKRKVIEELCEGMKHPPCNSNLMNRHIEISNTDIGAQIDILITYPRNSHNLLNIECFDQRSEYIYIYINRLFLYTKSSFRVTGQALTAELN